MRQHPSQRHVPHMRPDLGEQETPAHESFVGSRRERMFINLPIQASVSLLWKDEPLYTFDALSGYDDPYL